MNNGRTIKKEHADFLIYWAATDFDPKKKKECVSKAGYPEKNYHQTVRRILNSRIVNKFFQAEMLRQEVTPGYLISKLKEQLNCMHPQFSKMPDNISRNKAIEMAVRMYDGFPEKKVSVKQTKSTYIDFSPEIDERFKARTAQVIDAELIEEVEEEEDDERPF